MEIFYNLFVFDGKYSIETKSFDFYILKVSLSKGKLTFAKKGHDVKIQLFYKLYNLMNKFF